MKCSDGGLAQKRARNDSKSGASNSGQARGVFAVHTCYIGNSLWESVHFRFPRTGGNSQFP